MIFSDSGRTNLQTMVLEALFLCIKKGRRRRSLGFLKHKKNEIARVSFENGAFEVELPWGPGSSIVL